ncbi:hypothetical protein IWW38_002828, partial [Coemansia aciculifera]
QQVQLETLASDMDHLRRHLYTIDELTPSVETLQQPTRSKLMLATTKEYIEVASSTLNSLQRNEITEAQGRAITVNKMQELQRIMDARRQRERYASGKSIKKTVRENVGHMRSKARDTMSYSIDEFSGTMLVEQATLAVVIPSEDSLVQLVMEQKARCDEHAGPLPRPIYGNSITMFLKGNRFFHTYTKARCTIDADGNMRPNWYEDLVNEIKDKLKAVLDSDKYELEELEISVLKTHLHYYIQQIEDVSNWYKHAVPAYVAHVDFELFTANGSDKDCIQQVVEYFGEVFEESLTMEDMLAPRKVIYGHPANGNMQQVKLYSDLVWDFHEDMATTDCESIARIIRWNGHVGVITKLRPRPIKHAKGLRRRALKSKKVDYIDIFVDIEAFASSSPGKYMVSTPYLICWTEGEGVFHRSGPGCVEQFVITLLETYSDCEVCLYAWYGSGYDYQHIYKHLKKRCTDDNTFVRNNAIIYSKMTFKESNLVLHLKDPFLFILCSLDKAAKAFECLTKGSFPHEVIKDWTDLDTVIANWYIIRSETVEYLDQESNGKRLLITAKNHDEIVERGNLKSVMEKALEYCTIDVLAMSQIWAKFTDLVLSELGVQIDPGTFTLSQMSMKIMTAMLPPRAILTIPDLNEYDILKHGLYGGRVVAKNGVYEEDIYYADVVSLYPSAMRLLEHPAGEMKMVDLISWSHNGIYEVLLTSSKRPDNYMDFVPFRDENGQLTYHWRSYWKGTYHTYDLMIAKEQGYNIKCVSGMEWSTSRLFNGFIDKLFKMKADNTGPIRNIAKIALNGGGYGKFVQKPINSNVHIVEKGVVHSHFDRLESNSTGMIVKGGVMIERPDFYPLDDEWDKMVIEDPEAVPQYPVQVGISILSGSRYRLYNLIKQFPGIQVVYSDTDSIFVKASSVDKSEWISRMGNELGQLDDTLDGIAHGIINRMYVAGPKMYAYEYHDKTGLPKNVCHMKGVRTKDLKIEHFKHLLHSEEHRLVYNMIVMSKNLVGVKMAEIDKVIKQT